MAVISMKQLLEAGVHFGHQTRRWNPKMAPYIFTERNGIYIIDLQKTVKKISDAYDFMKEVAATGKPILFVGTKKQAQNAITDEAKRCGQYYVSERWLGGMLTNYKTISGRIKRLNDIEKMEEDGTFDKLSKKEVIKLRAEHVGDNDSCIIEGTQRFNIKRQRQSTLRIGAAALCNGTVSAGARERNQLQLSAAGKGSKFNELFRQK